MYQCGTLDRLTYDIAYPGGSYDAIPASKFFAEFNGAEHIFWSNNTCYAAGTVANCLATVPNAKLVVQYSSAFLNHYLNGQDEPLLWAPSTALADYRRASLVSAVSAATFQPGAPIAPESLFSVFGEGFSPGSTVNVTDSAGAAGSAQVFCVSAHQINALLPSGTALVAAVIATNDGSNIVGLGSVAVAAVSPSLFTAGQSVTVHGTTQTIQSLTMPSFLVPAMSISCFRARASARREIGASPHRLIQCACLLRRPAESISRPGPSYSWPGPRGAGRGRFVCGAIDCRRSDRESSNRNVPLNVVTAMKRHGRRSPLYVAVSPSSIRFQTFALAEPRPKDAVE